MNELVINNNKGESITTSLIVAEVFGKEHKNVLRDIESLNCSIEFSLLNFEPSEYTNERGKTYPMFNMTKNGFSMLVMGYTGIKAFEFKEKFINEFDKRDALLHNDDYIVLRGMEILNRRNKELEQKNAAQAEQIALQAKELKAQAPKAEYYDEVLDSEGLISSTIIAKDLGMSANSLNKKLHQMGIIYRQSDTWVPFSKYQDKGFCKSKTFPYTDKDGKQKTAIHFYWTEKGREFIMQKITAKQ